MLQLQRIIKLIFDGKPIAKKSVRRGRYGNMYNPQKLLMQQYSQMAKDQLPLGYVMPGRDQPISVDYASFMPTPKNLSKKKLEYVKNDDYPYLKKIDGDNIIKFYGDIMTGIVFNDDNQVNHNSVDKFYGLNPRIEITITIYEPIEIL